MNKGICVIDVLKKDVLKREKIDKQLELVGKSKTLIDILELRKEVIFYFSVKELQLISEIIELEIKNYPSKHLLSSDYYTRIHLLRNVMESVDYLVNHKINVENVRK